MALEQSAGEALLLGIEGFSYPDLYDVRRLEDLAVEFARFFSKREPALFTSFDNYRRSFREGIESGGLTKPEESRLLIDASRHLSSFLLRLFSIEPEAESLRLHATRDEVVARFKKDFVAKRTAKAQPIEEMREVESLDGAAELLIVAVTGSSTLDDREYLLARTINRLLEIERDYPRSAIPTGAFSPSAESRAALLQILDQIRSSRSGLDVLHDLVGDSDGLPADVTNREVFLREAQSLHALIDRFVQWSATRWRTPSERWNLRDWTSFRLPHPLHFDRLVPTDRATLAGVPVLIGAAENLRRRVGFGLTDARYTPRQISDEAHYCIYCHERKKDSCAHGFPAESPVETETQVPRETVFKPSALGIPLAGCPLDEKIGEMNLLRAEGDSVASLAVVMIDNPMCPGTGHRICNDCMRSCIFQKQEPVNIPQVETGVLTDVLFLPYGFEIYSLLTRWNPLNALQPVMRPYNGKNILIVGLGPAGYTLAHYFANEGFGVVGIDGLKIEPLPKELIGDDQRPGDPIVDVKELWDALDDRILAGFGGVSEYGITVRWDKNFLKCIRLALERRRNIRFYGGVRFGGTLTIADAFDGLDFAHIAIAAGAGTPTVVRMKNNLLRGIRKASDFLMALQLTGAFKRNSLANLQVRLPALVIGGGLTAIDTATELFAYYPVQVEKIVERYEVLVSAFGVDVVRAGYDPEEVAALDELLAHGKAVQQERRRAADAGETPNFIPLVRAWGGVTIAYRKGLSDSPAYRLNYEEVIKAMEEGIGYAERLSPIEAMGDDRGHVRSILFERQIVEDGRWRDSGEIVELPARSVMVAAGTSPNVIYEKEHPGTFELDAYKEFFQSHRAVSDHGTVTLHKVIDPLEKGAFFTSYQHAKDSDKLISFYGDNHPRYAGNVVKAMASAKDGFRYVLQILKQEGSRHAQAWEETARRLDDALQPRVTAVNRLTPTIVEVVVRAPFAAERFHPGQFYRLQNYETIAPEVDGTRLAMEGLALTGAWTDPSRGLLSLIILEMGGSSRLCAALKPGEPVVVMGPTGMPTEIPKGETVLLAGGGLGNAVLFSIARALKENDCRVVYFAGYKRPEDLFKQDEIEAATHQVIWSIDRGEAIPARRSQDLSFVGNIVQSILSYATGEIRQRPENAKAHGAPLTPLRTVDRLIAIGSDGMMRAVKDARHGVLAAHLNPQHIGIGSINSPMQCMMKQVCAQCLQRHVDPATGKETFVFSCFNQDQLLDVVDFDHLRARLRQNTVLEKLTNLWLTRLLSRNEIALV